MPNVTYKGRPIVVSVIVITDKHVTLSTQELKINLILKMIKNHLQKLSTHKTVQKETPKT